MTRRVMLVTHPSRSIAAQASEQLREELARCDILTVDVDSEDPIELVVVLGGDGTILSAAEHARYHDVPLIGVNLGHVGFLAEAERDSISRVAQRVAQKHYTVENRMTLDVEMLLPDGTVYTSWAGNELAIGRSDPGHMADLMVGVDGRGVSSYSCDGFIVATPTGSTAYSFSAGGPIIWPDVEAMVLVPIAAHALFTRPMVVGPSSEVEIEVLRIFSGSTVVWLDGRREFEVPVGTFIKICKGTQPMRLARIDETPFSGRLVAKFRLPVQGWRVGKA